MFISRLTNLLMSKLQLHMILTGPLVALFVLMSTWQTPAQNKTTDYWPIKIGNSWTFRMQSADAKVIITSKVTKVTQQSDGKLNGKVFTIENTQDSSLLQTDTYLVDSKGISRLDQDIVDKFKNRCTPPMLIFPNPIKLGREWTWKGTMDEQNEMTASSKYKVADTEIVKTPAGAFKAVHVHGEFTTEDESKKLTLFTDYWFAPNVGIVKQRTGNGKVFVEGVLTQYKVSK